jgi:thiamine-phosphate pyrophosphorylase
MLRCAITDRTRWPGTETEKQDALVRQAGLWAEQGIELIQLREKDLPTSALTNLAREILKAIAPARTVLLVNSNVDAAVASRAQGVHLTLKPGSATPYEVVLRYAAAGLSHPLITVSCHSLEEIQRVRPFQPDAILFAPVFGKIVAGKTITPAAGLEALSAACRAAAPTPVFALGGVTQGRARLCLDAGAAGIAGIRLFLNHNG